MRVIGVSGVSTAAHMEGDFTLKVADEDGHHYEVALGTSYASEDAPLNLLSVALLLREGALLHLKSGSCYFQPTPSAKKFR
jgi:hypothetical protein